MCTRTRTRLEKPEEGASDSLELDLHTLVSCLTWMLRNKLRFSGRAASTLSYPYTSLSFYVSLRSREAALKLKILLPQPSESGPRVCTSTPSLRGILLFSLC